MTVLDTPDYAKPLPGGSRTLLNTGFNLQTSSGGYTSQWIDVTAFSGLYIETNGFALPGSFGSFQVQFSDVGLIQPIFPKWTAFWRGDLPLRANVPVLGASARIQIIGPADNVSAELLVVGHGGGPGTQVGVASQVLANNDPNALAAGATSTVTVGQITEGAATLVFATQGGKGQAYVSAANSVGTLTVIGRLALPAGTGDAKRIYLPPQAVFLNIDNNDVGANLYRCALIRERS